MTQLILTCGMTLLYVRHECVLRRSRWWSGDCERLRWDPFPSRSRSPPVWFTSVTWLVHYNSVICDMTQSYVTVICDKTQSYVTWLSHMWQDSVICDMTQSYVTWLSHMWHDSVPGDIMSSPLALDLPQSRSCVWNDSSICVPWLSPMCDMTQSNVAWLSHMCDTHLFMTCHICICVMSHIDTWHDVYTSCSRWCVTWRI